MALAGQTPTRLALVVPILLLMLLGTVCVGSIGGGYGAYLHFHPEYKEKLIQQRVSQPHPDNYYYLASAQAIRYMGLWEFSD